MKVYMVLTYLQDQYKRSLNTDATVIVYNIHTACVSGAAPYTYKATCVGSLLI